MQQNAIGGFDNPEHAYEFGRRIHKRGQRINVIKWGAVYLARPSHRQPIIKEMEIIGAITRNGVTERYN